MTPVDEDEGTPATRVCPPCASDRMSKPKSKELSGSKVIGDTSSTSEVVGKVIVAHDIGKIVLIDDASDSEVIDDVWLAEVVSGMWLPKVIDVI